MPVHVLGISAYFHDSAAALIRDGVIVAAAQEERFSRRKHDDRFPRRAVAYCLEEAGIGPADLSAVAFYERPLVKFERLLESHVAAAPRNFAAFAPAVTEWAGRKLRLPRVIRSSLAGYRGPLFCAEHHASHAASAFYPSPFAEAAILTMDAVGEWATSAIGVGRDARITLSHELRFPHSLGMLYSAFTHYAGFKVNSGEYKLMGLAPYGRPIHADLICEKLVDIREDGSIWLDMRYFDYVHGTTMTSPAFHSLFGGPPRRPEARITQKEMNLAASIQKVTEEIVLRAAAYAHQLTGIDRLVMAGGVALNCVANGRLLREGPFREIWIQPAAGDAGGALGAALQVWHETMGHPRTVRPSDAQHGSLLGPSFRTEEIALFLDSVGAHYERIERESELLDRVSRLLAAENVLGWFHGRMEYGPRALGARSIIGDARSRHMQQVMNLKIKFRESFRPFAPCVLRDHVHEVFDTQPRQDSPYMLFVAPVRSELRLPEAVAAVAASEEPDLRVRLAVPRSTLPAITHVDYSARLQTVDEQRHGRFARLLKTFRELTGCPVIVNTSFNIRGEPIVCTPEDAFRCFMATEMDGLILEDCLLLKENQPVGLREDADEYRRRYALD